MKEKFKYIILPPDAFHMTLRDTLSSARGYISAILDIVEKIRQPGERVLVKYRTENQRKLFPTKAHSRVGYGRLLDFCDLGTVVIGRPGSATWECLLNDISFYGFWDFKVNNNNLFTSREAWGLLSNIIHIAQTQEELQFNLSCNMIFRSGKSKLDLTHPHTMGLAEIVSIMLANNGQGSVE